MWLANPMASPLLWPTAVIIGCVMGAALLGLLVKEHHAVFQGGPRGASLSLKEWRRNELFQRLLTWGWIAPLYTMSMLSGWLPTLLFVSVIVFQGLREYASLAGLPKLYRWVLLGAGLLAAPAALHSTFAFYGLPALLLLGATLQPVLAQDPKVGVRHLAFAVFGWGYLPWLLGHFMLMRLYVPGGDGLLLALGLAVGLSDVAAFVAGKALGKHRLAPRLSPNKTWEGVAGNFVGAALGVFLMGFALPEALPWHFGPLLAVTIGLACAWGDLLESALKRGFQVKDAGDWLPGFGGLLDRIDSLIIAVPLAYYLAKVGGLSGG
ncbi:MAG: phosphatidate cytidylyltransferase [Chloroflexi bacterium]|nr:phosphatidate cytidylyltransferase [Chloroflexota bacterium]